MTGDLPIYIVDWDLPYQPPGLRRSFYRKLARLRKEWDLGSERSSFSVLRTANWELAKRVYELASGYGRANLYEARLLKASHL